MTKLLRIISTVLIIIGLMYIFLYLTSKQSGIEIFQTPSYYIRQNFWYIFIAGIVIVFSSILAGFFAWHKMLESKDEVLLNAGFAGRKQISSWLNGSTLDEGQPEGGFQNGEQNVEDRKYTDSATEIIEGETEILHPETEILREEEWT